MSVGDEFDGIDNGFERVLKENASRFNRVSNAALNMIETALEDERINVLSVERRVKSIESAKAKLENKKYSNPLREMTDIVGLRVIVFLESDVDRAEKCLETLFEIDLKTLQINVVLLMSVKLATAPYI